MRLFLFSVSEVIMRLKFVPADYRRTNLKNNCKHLLPIKILHQINISTLVLVNELFSWRQQTRKSAQQIVKTNLKFVTRHTEPQEASSTELLETFVNIIKKEKALVLSRKNPSILRMNKTPANRGSVGKHNL